jgi:hypothetical protein
MSMTNQRNESGYKHLMRVRLGQHGAKGSLRRCEKKDGSGIYWRIKIDGGEWAWPDGMVIDGPGELLSNCRDCGLPFIHERAGEPLCRYCDEDAHGTTQRAQEPSDYQGTRARGPARLS